MAGEYLLFNLVVVAGPLLAGRYPPTSFRHRWIPALVAAITVAVPFVAWDALVTGRHWTFNEAYTSVRLLGLPLGEWAFFLTVPLACSSTWEMLSGGVDPARSRLHRLARSHRRAPSADRGHGLVRASLRPPHCARGPRA